MKTYVLKQLADFPPLELGEGRAGSTLFDSPGDLSGKPVQGLLIQLLIIAFVRKDPDFPFKKGERCSTWGQT